MENCIFCKIVRGEIPAEKTFESDALMAFLDVHPKAPGHTLLIPKDHHKWFVDLPDTLSEELFRQAKELSKILLTERGADYIQLSIVGTDVPHVHVHLIPRTLSEPGQ